MHHTFLQHVIRQKMAFAPLVCKLYQGYTEINHDGEWETLGYDFFAMYKSDMECHWRV